MHARAPGRTCLLLAAPLLAACTLVACAKETPRPESPPRPVVTVVTPRARQVILFVWDGLRPDSISPEDTPNLDRLAHAGVSFSDHHATYPTFTMMNAASLATGGFPVDNGFYGNWVYERGPSGKYSSGLPIDFAQPVFTEDYGVLEALDTFHHGALLTTETLLQAAQKAGLQTVTLGKAGPAFLQDYGKGGMIVDEDAVFPRTLVAELQTAGLPLPKLTPNAYPPGDVVLAPDNGDPTAGAARKKLADGVTSDPTDTSGSPHDASNRYLMRVFLEHILPKRKPDLSVIWLRSPDSTEHQYGVGTANHKDALRAQDALLGQLQGALETLGLAASTDILVVSDHAHSNVSGPLSLFPLRAIAGGAIGAPDPKNGYSVSGDVRFADLLTRAGFKAFDGSGCVWDPVLSGIRADGKPVYPTRTDDAKGSVCGTPGKPYTTAAFEVPAKIPPRSLVLASSGGSEYVYVLDRDPETVKTLVRFIQSREEMGPVLVSRRYGSIPGTLPLDTIYFDNDTRRAPDVVVSYEFDEKASISGAAGTEFESMMGNRGMHGTFSPIDVHNTLVAFGPHFVNGFSDPLPSGNVDVAPTIAKILGFPFEHARGRPLLEALQEGAKPADYTVVPTTLAPETQATRLVMKLPTSPAGADVDRGKTSYTFELRTKKLSYGGKMYTYFDSAKVTRK